VLAIDERDFTCGEKKALVQNLTFHQGNRSHVAPLKVANFLAAQLFHGPHVVLYKY
jgi:hypothetical protein